MDINDKMMIQMAESRNAITKAIRQLINSDYFLTNPAKAGEMIQNFCKVLTEINLAENHFIQTLRH